MLNNNSRELLLSTFIYSNPDFSNWIKIADHLTICMGELPEHLKRYWLDEEITLIATHIGVSDNAVAVKVNGYFIISKNTDLENDGPKFAHITLAINPIDAKPADSNKIINWIEIDPLELKGIIKEISNQS